MESLESYLESYFPNISRKICYFLQKLVQDRFTLPDIFAAVLTQPSAPAVFMVGLEFEKNFIRLCVEKEERNSFGWKIEKVEKEQLQNYSYYEYAKARYDQIKEIFEEGLDSSNRLSDRIIYCRNFVKLPIEQGPDCQIYYYASISQADVFDTTYLSSLEKEYYKWIHHKFVMVVDSFVSEEEICNISEREGLLNKERKELLKKADKRFHQDVKKLLGIDLDLIIELSGSYYEGAPCRSRLLFCYSTEERRNSLVLDKPFEFIPSKMRLVRKLIQTGQENHDLFLIRQENNSPWIVKGVCPSGSSVTSDTTAVTFRLIRHMVWEMEINQKMVVRYDCGQYRIITNNFYVRQFGDIYEEIFEREVPAGLLDAFNAACQQTHGTVLLVAENAEEESKRLVEESAGIRIESDDLSYSLREGITSIDGAVLVDENGRCYGAGFILDGKEPLKGRDERGSRYNSTARYIWTRNKNGQVMIAVIVSEDKSIDIISTLDEFGEVQKNGI